MKRLKIFWITVIAIAIHSSASAQVTITSSTTFITPITITKNVDQVVGKKKSASSAVVAAAAGTAQFNASAQDHYIYSVTLPVTCTVVDAARHTMTVSSFTSNPVTGNINPGSSQVLHVGATLHIAAGQAAGNYKSISGVPVTVNYN